MNEIMIFNNPVFGSVRTVCIDGEPWLVGKDVAEILGYSNTRAAILRHVDEEDKATVTIRDGSQDRVKNVINESGFYSLVSKLETIMLDLPDSDKELIRMLFFEKKTERECAEHFGINQKNINKKKQRILCRLNKLLEKSNF